MSPAAVATEAAAAVATVAVAQARAAEPSQSCRRKAGGNHRAIRLLFACIWADFPPGGASAGLCCPRHRRRSCKAASPALCSLHWRSLCHSLGIGRSSSSGSSGCCCRCWPRAKGQRKRRCCCRIVAAPVLLARVQGPTSARSLPLVRANANSSEPSSELERTERRWRRQQRCLSETTLLLLLAWLRRQRRKCIFLALSVGRCVVFAALIRNTALSNHVSAAVIID